jgi:hypothetical protein
LLARRGVDLRPDGLPAARVTVLLHDAHEAYIGDVSTPLVQALDAFCQGAFGPLLSAYKLRLDRAIYRAAGVNLPDEVERAAIKTHDIAMLNAERYALKASPPQSWGDLFDSVPAARVSLPDLGPWDAPQASDEWLSAFTQFVAVKI